MCACVCPSGLGRAGWPPGRVFVRLTFSCGRASVRSLFVRPPPGLGCPFCGCCWMFQFFFLFSPRCLRCSLFSSPGCLGPWRLMVLPPAPPLFAPPSFFLSPPCLSCFVVSGSGCLGLWRSVVPSPGFPPPVFFSLPPCPPPLLFAVLLFLLCSLFLRSCLFFFFPWCAGVVVLGPVCVSWVVRCSGVCCCARCASARDGVCLCCVVGCALVVSVLCVLLPVVLRCCGVRCVLPGGAWRACVGPGSCSVLLAPVAVAWSSVLVRGCVLSCDAVPRCSCVLPVVWCAAVCVVSCWWCLVVSIALAGAARCCLWLPAVCCWVWSPAVNFRWCVISRVLLPRGLACCSAVCCGLLWCPAPLCCVLCSVVLCRCVVPCCGALLFVFLLWWCCVLSLCVRCCVALRWVLFGAGLVRAFVCASCCGLSLCVAVSLLTFCGVVVLLWCIVVCAVVLRRLVVPWCLAVVCVFLLLRVFFFY